MFFFHGYNRTCGVMIGFEGFFFLLVLVPCIKNCVWCLSSGFYCSLWIISLGEPQLLVPPRHFSWASFPKEEFSTLQNGIEEVQYNYKACYQELLGSQVGLIQYIDLELIFLFSLQHPWCPHIQRLSVQWFSQGCILKLPGGL